MKLSKIGRCVLTDGVALLLALIASLVASIYYHVPPALTLIQALSVLLLVQAWPLSVLSHEKSWKKPTHHRGHQTIVELAGFGSLAAMLGYANYLLCFARHAIDPAYIDTAHPLYLQATTVAFLTIGLCQFMNLLFVRSDEKQNFFTDYLWSNKKLVRAYLMSAFCVLNVIYNPGLHGLFGSQPLDVVDWLAAIAGAGLYTGLRVLQRHSRRHTRHAVIKLHREVHGSR